MTSTNRKSFNYDFYAIQMKAWNSSNIVAATILAIDLLMTSNNL